MAAPPLAEIIDLARYPIDTLDAPPGRALVERVRADLRAQGAATSRASCAARRSRWRSRARAPSTTAPTAPSRRTTSSSPDSRPTSSRRTILAGHACARPSRARRSTTSRRLDRPRAVRVPGAARLRGRGARDRPDLPLRRSAGRAQLHVLPPGDELGWHFDNAHFIVTLLLQAAEAGGVFEFAPMLRSEDDRNDAGVRALLAGDRSRVRTMSGEPGTLALFRGHWSPHRVTPVEGDRMRMNAVLSFARRPGSASAARPTGCSTAALLPDGRPAACAPHRSRRASSRSMSRSTRRMASSLMCPLPRMMTTAWRSASSSSWRTRW